MSNLGRHAYGRFGYGGVGPLYDPPIYLINLLAEAQTTSSTLDFVAHDISVTSKLIFDQPPSSDPQVVFRMKDAS